MGSILAGVTCQTSQSFLIKLSDLLLKQLLTKLTAYLHSSQFFEYNFKFKIIML